MSWYQSGHYRTHTDSLESNLALRDLQVSEQLANHTVLHITFGLWCGL